MKDGGYAFPQPIAGDRNGLYTSAEKDSNNAGMSLRDYFASAALTGMLSNEGTVRQGVLLAQCSDAHDALQTYVSIVAYGYADAMLAARGE